MEATGLSLGKSALNGALGYAKSAITQEVALQLGVQRDHAFIRDELEMMLSFLMAAHEEQEDHKVVKTWVKQVRNVAYDVEDCLQDFTVRLGKPSWWCFIRTMVDRHRVATRMKELRARVEDVSQRNVRYRLIKGTEPKPATGSGPSSISSATMFGTEEARRQKDKAKVDLSQLINEGGEDLRVISVWGTSGLLGQTVVIKGVYDDLKRSKKFELYAWIRIVRPFNPLEFVQCIMRQFYRTSFEEVGKIQEKSNIGAQVLKKMGVMRQGELLEAFSEYVDEKRYLIVLNDLSTIEEWDCIREYLPNNNKGSRIIVSSEQGEVARICVGQESVMSDLKQPSVYQSMFAFYDKVYQNGTKLTKQGSSSNESIIITTNNSLVPSDEILGNRYQDVEILGNHNEEIAGKSLTRTGTIASALEESLLIGREKEKYGIINLISSQDIQQLKVISVWGMGGLGKTTLVKEVYQSPNLSGLFHKRACITIMRPFIFKEVIKSIAMQLDAASSNWKEYNIEELDKLLEGKSCLIVLDDLSSVEEWDMIIPSLSKMGNTSRIIVTTREENIAKHCSVKTENIYKLKVLEYKDAFDLFTKKVFNKEATNLDNYPGLVEEAELILKRCNGLPLAIVTIGGFLAKQPKTSVVWKKLNEHLSAELEMNPELGIIKAILMKSYDGLPYHLKSCFLYFSIFPEDYNISRRRMVHRWNAEGYSSDVRGKSMGKVADSYFMELIDRSMILPAKESIGSRKGISSCKLHDLMREISISKAMEENLVFRMEEGCSSNTQGTIRHLAISSNWEGDQSEFEDTVDLSRIRSLTVFGKWKPFYISNKMRLLQKIMEMEDDDDDSLNRRDVCAFMCCVAFPFIARLADPGGVVVPRGLRKLKALRTLGVVNIAQRKPILQDMKRLTRLNKLSVTGINKKNCQEFCSTLEHLSHLESLSVGNSREWAGLRGCLDDLRSPPKNLQSLKLVGSLGKLPEWIAGLQNLVKLKLRRTRLTDVDGTVQVLGKLPNLAIIRLLTWSFRAEEPRCFTSRQEAFPSLTVLELKLGNGIRSVEFEQGTAPRLELLCSNDSISFSGLSFLQSLKEVLIDKPCYSEESVEDMRAQLTRNPNKPVLKFE
ncbi:unnamed protein product [Urochloa decumbens]|uniref:Uncharacterized protein n=1 Tax=Urochloa decumbens TaxID=240449 RepID=A0ABC9FPR8_9POAL